MTLFTYDYKIIERVIDKIKNENYDIINVSYNQRKDMDVSFLRKFFHGKFFFV